MRKTSREITVNKYETREISLVPEVIEANSGGCVYFSFDSGKTSGLSASESVPDKNRDMAFDKINGFSNEGQKGGVAKLCPQESI